MNDIVYGILCGCSIVGLIGTLILGFIILKKALEDYYKL